MTHLINNKLSRFWNAFSILLQVHLMKWYLLLICTVPAHPKFVCLCAFFKFPHVSFCIQCTVTFIMLILELSLLNRFTSAAYLLTQPYPPRYNLMIIFPTFKRTTNTVHKVWLYFLSPTHIYFWWPTFYYLLLWHSSCSYLL